jgi:hypothetical protein
VEGPLPALQTRGLRAWHPEEALSLTRVHYTPPRSSFPKVSETYPRFHASLSPTLGVLLAG